MTPDQQNTSKGRWMFVPDGWRVVPREPADEMIRAVFCFPIGERRFVGDVCRENEVVNLDTSLAIYRAMLAASPSPPEVREVTTQQLAQAIREEIVRQYRDDERRKCPAGASFYEERVGPMLIAEVVLRILAPSDQDVTGGK